jgi:hypothetical protein
MTTPFEQLLVDLHNAPRKKSEQAISFLWYYTRSNQENETDLTTISNLFIKASLPKPNTSRLQKAFTTSRKITKGSFPNTYKLTWEAARDLDKEFGHIFTQKTDLSIPEAANVSSTPFLENEKIEDAYRMAELYVILHCYENSVRQFITKILSEELGTYWWDQAASNPMKTSVNNRKQVETKKKWLSPRGNTSPLYYLEWGDLEKLIRKYQHLFVPYIGELRFIESRFGDLESLRNIVAHNGVLPSQDDFQRVIISFRDWTRQISSRS